MEDIKIVPPKGYEIDRKNSTLDCIKFRQIQSSNLPKTWEEFCENYPVQKGEAWMDVAGNINTYEKSCNTRNHTGDKTVLPSKEIASAMVALCQLIQLRDYYNDGWEPDWSDINCNKWCIEPFNTRIDKQYIILVHVFWLLSQMFYETNFLRTLKICLKSQNP